MTQPPADYPPQQPSFSDGTGVPPHYQPPAQYPQSPPLPPPPPYQPPYQPTYEPPAPPPYQPAYQEPPTTQYAAPPQFGAPATPGPPPVGMTNPYQPVGPPPKQGVNGFAIASLILGICGGVLLSVIFGIVALIQVKRSGQSGKGMAVAGLALSGLWVVGGVAAAVFVLATTPDRDPTSGQFTEDTTVTLEDVKAGDCITSVTEDKMVFNVPVVPCTDPHRAEVTDVVEMPAGDYPGDEVVDSEAQDICAEAFDAYAPSSIEDETLEVFYFPPNRTTWGQGDRNVICMLNDPDTMLTKSLKG